MDPEKLQANKEFGETLEFIDNLFESKEFAPIPVSVEGPEEGMLDISKIDLADFSVADILEGKDIPVPKPKEVIIPRIEETIESVQVSTEQLLLSLINRVDRLEESILEMTACGAPTTVGMLGTSAKQNPKPKKKGKKKPTKESILAAVEKIRSSNG